MRKKYLDNIRWITVVLVVIYHVIYMYNSILTVGLVGPFKEVQYQDAYLYMVYPWFMVLLFAVAGISSRCFLEKHSDKDFIRTRTRKLLVPSTIGVVVFQWILGYYNMVLAQADVETLANLPVLIRFFIMIASGIGPLWFIQLLWLYSMLLVLIRKVEKDRLYNLCGNIPLWGVILLGIGVWASAQVLNMPYVVVYRFGIYCFVFFVGYFVLSHENVVAKLSEYWLAFIILDLALCITFVIKFWGEPFADHVVLKTAFCNVYAWITVLSVLAFMYKFGNFENSITAFMKKQSWGLYIFHYLFVAMTAYYLHMFVPLLNPVLTYLVVGFTAFAGSFLLNYLVGKTRIVKWCILGEKSEERIKRVV